VAPSRSSDNSEPCDFFECNPHYELKCTASQVHHFTLPQRARAFLILFRKGVWAEKSLRSIPVYDPRIRFADLLFQARTVTAHGREGSCHHRLQVSASPPRRGEALERELAIPARALARALARTLAPERRGRRDGGLVRWASQRGPTRGLGGLQGGAPAHAPLGPTTSDERVGGGLVWVGLNG
jgi:hypothetical protein